MKFSTPLLLGATYAGLTAAQLDSASTQNSSSSTACADIHLIVVRASTEKPGQGIIGTLATMISAAHPGSSVEAIDYPATLTDYANSSSNGTAQTTKQLKSYVDGCSKAKVVLLGYSQGAHVIGDVMCGGGGASGALGAYTAPVEDKYAEKVVAMIQMGDPRHMANVSWDVGSSVRNGIFPRTANQTCAKYSNIIQTYCNTGDPFCDGGNNSTVHLLYTVEYNNDAFNFVQKKLAAATSTNSSTTSTASSSGSTSSSTSGTGSTNKSSAATLMASSSILSVLGTSALVALFCFML